MVLDNTLSSWLEHIETLHSKPIDMGLERMKEMLARMNISFAGKTVITVGGTNGKGSTCAMLESIYRAAGYSTWWIWTLAYLGCWVWLTLAIRN